jgi:Ca2+-transporting ATPase
MKKKELITTSMWASRPVHFWSTVYTEIYSLLRKDQRPDFKMIRIWLSGELYDDRSKGRMIICCKGASSYNGHFKLQMKKKHNLGIIKGIINWRISDFNRFGKLFFEGNYQKPTNFNSMDLCYKGKHQCIFGNFINRIIVKSIYWNNASSTSSIAKQIGFIGYEKREYFRWRSMQLSDNELKTIFRNQFIL